MNSKINFESKEGVTFLSVLKYTSQIFFFLIKDASSNTETEKDQE